MWEVFQTLIVCYAICGLRKESRGCLERSYSVWWDLPRPMEESSKGHWRVGSGSWTFQETFQDPCSSVNLSLCIFNLLVFSSKYVVSYILKIDNKSLLINLSLQSYPTFAFPMKKLSMYAAFTLPPIYSSSDSGPTSSTPSHQNCSW